jgi:hypothetical protein
MGTAGMSVHEKYRLGPRLGSGGMADVFRAELIGAAGFSRPVAIKRLHTAVSADSDFCAMFAREARLLAALHHPAIVSVLDFEWDADGRLFLVMELVDGVNLAQLVRRGPLPAPVVVHLMTEVLRGLGHAHARGILHRDVSPHNVLLAWTGEVKLGDFGLARAAAGNSVSDHGTIRGKVPYLSPEQLQGLTIDARSDLFSLGVMSYQLLTGRFPFFGREDQPTVAEAIARMLTVPIQPPHELRPELPRALSDVVMKLLERERERRFADAEAVTRALAEARADARADARAEARADARAEALADARTDAVAEAMRAAGSAAPPAAAAPPAGQEALAALLAERFPGRAAGASATGGAGDAAMSDADVDGPTPHASAPDAPRTPPGHDTHTTLLRAVRDPRNAQAPAPRRRAPALRLGLVLALVAVPLVWLGARRPRAELDQVDGHRAASAAPAPAPVDLRPEPVHAATAPATAASVAAGASGPAPGPAPEPSMALPRAGRALPRRASKRLPPALPAPPEPAATVAPQEPPGAVQDAPEPIEPAVTPPPAARRYERGWTEGRPQRTVTGEVPILRGEP